MMQHAFDGSNGQLARGTTDRYLLEPAGHAGMRMSEALAMFLPVMTSKVAGFRRQWNDMPTSATFSEVDRRSRLEALDALERAALTAAPYGADTDVLRWQHRLMLVRRLD
jgi:hypothetical protein